MRRNLIVAVALVLASTGMLFAQGLQTGSITGTVSSTDGAVLPGATVSLKSDALLGVRAAVTDAHGGYIFKSLPPGTYKITYSLANFGTVEKTITLALSNALTLPVTLSVSVGGETLTVSGEAPTTLTTTQIGENYTKETVDALPLGRTVFGIAQLAPGLTTNTPNANQLQIAGNFAYDNVFLVDGVDVNDNLFGTSNTLFVEDAIEETQVLTSAISAEYGRFGGGIVNTVTKKGGNAFAGSFRMNLTNPSWRDETPYEDSRKIERADKTSKFYEATLGGPIVKDRLWFFAAGRSEASETQATLPESGKPFNATRDQTRGQIKLTGAITENHNVSFNYLTQSTEDYRQVFTWSIEPERTAFTGTTPNTLLNVAYNGVLRPNLFVEAQYSQKKFKFENFGGTTKDIIDSPFIAQSVLALYNGLYFDATDPEERNNRQFSAALSYYLSTGSLGKHDLKMGFESFTSTRTGGNSQSPTNYVFYTDYLTDAAGEVVYDSNGYVIPVFEPGVSQLQLWQAVRGAEIDITTTSFYVNDRWAFNKNFSFNLGLRAEWGGSSATGDIAALSAFRMVPRLAASYDVKGDGKFKLDASYAKYAGKYAETQFANNTNVGNPDFIYYQYTGPAGQGRSFAAGFDPKNYSETLTGGFPTSNIFYDEDIKAPVTTETTVSFGTDLGKGGYLKATYIWRDVSDFVQSYSNTTTGTTHVVKNAFDYGTFTNQLWANDNTGKRQYQAMEFQAGYKPISKLNLQGHYTLMVKDDGNQEGEGSNTPGAPSFFSGYYPEIFNEARTYPMGKFDDYQKHRVRLWTTYDLGLGRAGSLNLGLLFRYDSGIAYSLRSTGVALSSTQKSLAAASGYVDIPGDQPLFYSVGRGSETFESQKLADFAITYGVPVWKTVRPWVKFEVRNFLNSTPLIGYNITVSPDKTSPTDTLGLPTGYTKGGSFGKGTSTAHYPFPREILLSLGIRF